ncbi:FMN-dependent NADH-azoreductase [Naumannella halotolerans]|uniref:FMN-dependent NADH-azoreductase n=1 Tax=Naumannella halotolerans TaxID=993414 RepID=UPI00370D94E2
MRTLLRLDSSAGGELSVTRSLTGRFASGWLAAGDDREVIARDLHADPLPHLETSELHFPPVGRLTEVAESDQQRQDEVVEQLRSADVVVIGAPMYNYSMPSTLKTWIDRIHLPGITFDLEPLPMAGKPVVLISASGAAYDPGTPTEGWDHVLPPLQIVLGDALGMDVHVVTSRLTLADRDPQLAAFSQRAEQERADAESTLDRLASTL